MIKGFTLIELVVVIVILGILTVVAVPKFIQLQSDAYKSEIKNVEAMFKDATRMTYSKVQIANPNAVYSSGTSFDVDGDGTNDALVFGKPRAQNNGIMQLVNIDALWQGMGQSKSTVCNPSDKGFCAFYLSSLTEANVTPVPAHFVVVVPPNYRVIDNCFAFYYQATNSSGNPETGYNRNSALNAGSVTSGC